MLRTNLPRAVRHLRRRRGWRQRDLADASGVSRQVISRIERGQELGRNSLRTVSRLADALDASVDVTLRWHGEELDRLIDSGHAQLVQETVALFASLGWLTRVEVSFSHYGDRGRVDVLAWHAHEHVMVVVEVKSAVGDVGETLGRLDVKARLGSVLAASVGWDSPRVVLPALVIGDARSARRLVAAHDALFARYSLRGRQAWAWLRSPFGAAPTGLLWFANVPNARGAGVTRHARVRTVTTDG